VMRMCERGCGDVPSRSCSQIVGLNRSACSGADLLLGEQFGEPVVQLTRREMNTKYARRYIRED
jgi:hypothetical protein